MRHFTGLIVIAKMSQNISNLLHYVYVMSHASDYESFMTFLTMKIVIRTVS